MPGFTDEERFLNHLARKSFLRFWSWPNLFRDQRNRGSKGDGKELCDLLVVFGDDVLLFSDKKIKFNTEKPLNIAWARWAREAIHESVKQVVGARRWLVDYKDRIFLNKECSEQLPLELPEKDQAAFHFIVVCHGCEKAAAEHHGAPSFSFCRQIVDNEHWDSNKCEPFVIGNVFNEQFVHVFNEATIELVLSEFDTISDFINYLNERKNLLHREDIFYVACESDIIQLHYENYDEDKKNYCASRFSASPHSAVTIDKGGLRKLLNNPVYLAKKSADEISYFWDDLVEAFSFHVLNGTSEGRNWELPHQIEPGLRALANTNRFQRRLLSQAFMEFYEKTGPEQRGTRIVLDVLDDKRAFIFFLLPHLPRMGTIEDYRKLRRSMLTDYCVINKYLRQSLNSIVMIAARTRTPSRKLSKYFFDEGQDFVIMDCSDWDEKDYASAKEVYDEFISKGLMSKQKMFAENVRDFPQIDGGKIQFREWIHMKGSDRNKPCPCGSNLKYKKCCGRHIAQQGSP